MRKTTLFTLLTMLFLLTGSNVWADDSWVKTAPEDLETGDVVAIIELVNGYALPNDNGTTGAPAGVSIALNEDETELGEEPAGNLQWVVTADEGNLQFGVADTESYLYCTNSNNGVRVGTNPNNVFTIQDDYLYNIATTRYIGVYLTNPDWRCYTTINNNIKDQAFGFFKKVEGGSGTTVAKPVIEPNGGTFTEPVTVTITAGEDCQIYYTTDGTDPEMTHGLYTEPFVVSETCTVKAVAYDVTGAPSSIASATFKFPSVITSIEELCAADKGEVTVQFIGWTVTGVKGKNAYFSDGKNGILLYEDGHGFEVGDQLRGQATFNLAEYKGAPEIMGLKATTEGVVVAGKGIQLTPIETTIGELDNSMQGCVIKLTDLTYTEGVFRDVAGADITPYNTFNIEMPTLEEGKQYDATGIFVWFDGTKEIAPRTTDDFVEAGGAYIVAKPVITPNGGTFTEPQEVTITAEEGCTIIYTTDGTDPSLAAGSQYTEPFKVSENCTVKAIAIDVTGAPSAIASAEFTFISATAVPSIARLCPLAPEEGEVEVLVEFNNWVVTGVRGGQVYFTDGPNGIVNYKRDHGFEVGDVVNGRAIVTLTTYGECAEITNLTKDTEGITVTKGEGATPIDVVVADLYKDMQGCLIRLKEVTYSEGKFVDGDDNTIEPLDKFITLPTLIEGQTYNAVGVAVWYVPTDGSGYWRIAPREAEEFELITSKQMPESSWSVEEEVVDINGEVTAVFTTNSDGLVTLESSNESVAIIDAAGLIRPVGRGVTTITANVAETDNFLPDSKSFTLTVVSEGFIDATFAYDDEDIQGRGISGGGEGFSATRDDVVTLTFTNAYGAAQHIKVYGNNSNDIEKSNVELSVVDGYAISQIEFTITGDQDTRSIWVDQFGVEPEYSADSLKVTWVGLQNKVVLNNLYNTRTLRPKQARIRTINVTIMKLEDTGKTIVIGESGRTTFCSDAKVVLSGAEQFAVASVVPNVDGPVIVTDDLGTVVPAFTGVVLTGAPGEYKVYTRPDLEENQPTANYLMGVLEDVAAPYGSYVLQEAGTMATFQIVEEETNVTVPAGQAYLSMPGTLIPTLFFTKEDYETGINAVNAEISENGVIYNVAGQRLQKMQKGVNIVGGKKILK